LIKRIPLLLSCLLWCLFVCHDAMAADAPVGQQNQPESFSPIPVGQTEEKIIPGQGQIEADVFGKKGGYYHPFLLFEERWTDNLYYTNSKEEEDFITTISPGIWLALPANREKLLKIGTTTTSPGGLKVSRMKPEAARKFQSYLFYAPEFVYYADNSQHDAINHQVEGMLQYNLNMGLSIDVVDQYQSNHEPNDNGISERIDKYKDNLFDLLLVYETPERFKFRFDYSNYDLNYDDDVNEYRNRNDNSYAFYAFYKVKPKTSVFVEYEFADIRYDEYTDSDSSEHRYYGGLDWNMTAKTNGRIKLGYIEKDFDKGSAFDDDDFSLEIQTQHNFTPKRALKLVGFRRFNESSLIDSSAVLTTGITAAWLQRFTEKWSGTLQCSFTMDEYDGLITYNRVTDDRVDDIFSIAPALRYKMRDWLVVDFAYIFAIRDSNFSLFDYTTNTIFFRVDIFI